MKLSSREAERFFSKPDPKCAGLLIYGSDQMRVALKRRQVLDALLGRNAREEMRLERLEGSDLRSSRAPLMDAIKAIGFFPGRRVVLVEGASDACASSVSSVLGAWREGDAVIVATAGRLPGSSRLRKTFESGSNTFAAGIYDDPVSTGEVRHILDKAGIGQMSHNAMAMLTELARTTGPGEFAQIAEVLALYTLGRNRPIDPEDIAAVTPLQNGAEFNDLVNAVADTQTGKIDSLLRRLQSQGASATGLCIAASRHFRGLYTVASDPSGPAAGVRKLRPPVSIKQRDNVLRQARGWGPAKLERAITILADTDLSLRAAGQTAPPMAVIERAMVRLTMLGAR